MTYRALPCRTEDGSDGCSRVCDPSGGRGDEVASRIATALERHVRTRRLGWVVLDDRGFLVARRPDRVLAAVAAFVSHERLGTMPAGDLVPAAPDFAIEVRSAGEEWVHAVARAGTWIACGVGVVWCVDPETRTATVHRARRPTEELSIYGVLDAAPALPDFRLRVADLLEGPA